MRSLNGRFAIFHVPLLLLLLLFPAVACKQFDVLWKSPVVFLTPTPASATISPLATPTPLPPGLTRQDPLWPENSVSTNGWQLSLNRYMRGAEAEQFVIEGFSYNDPPPAGMEYVAVNLQAELLENVSIKPYFQIRLTGEQHQVYDWFDTHVIPPDPRFETDFESIAQTEGWLIFEIPQGEEKLMLIIADFEDYDAPDQYLALESGTYLLAAELPILEPSENGRSLESAIPFKHRLTTTEWQVELLDIIRGEEAWDLIYETNSFNDPPPEGMEYMLIKAYIRNLRSGDESIPVSQYEFDLLDAQGRLIEQESVVDPEPDFDFTLYSGGEAEGWFALSVPKEEYALYLRFEPPYNYDEEWYLSLLLIGR